MSAQDEVAAAASTVTGVDVTAHYRQSLKTGDGFVKWEGRTRGDEGLGWIDTWQVWIALPQDVKSGQAWLTEHLEQLIDAIDDVLVVTAAAPRELLLGSKPTNGLIIEGTRPSA
jgi:hypothetical protein